jgi:hypothetical protein
MTDLRMRPRFTMDLACDAETLVQVLRDRIDEAEPPLEGGFDVRHCLLRIPRSRRSLWSPELDLTFEPRSDGRPGVRLRCLYAPRSEVWTGFAFLYAALSAAGVIGAVGGIAQATLSAPPWGFAATGAALVLIAAIYAAGYVGRGLSIDEMYQLQRYLDVCIEGAERRFQVEQAAPVDLGRIRRWVAREVRLDVELRAPTGDPSGPPLR